METNEKHVKEQLINTIKNIKKKYRSLNQHMNEINESLNIKYKPILEPLNKIVEKYDATNEKSDPQEKNNDLIRKNPIVVLNRMDSLNVNDFLKIINTAKHDPKYGVHKQNDLYLIGKTEVKFETNNIIVANESFPLSVGLLSLLFLKKPESYSETDKGHYKQIITLTNIHKTSNGRMRGDYKNYKYKQIIAPLFAKVGRSLETNFMEFQENERTLYKYWDDPNELVDRLRLLVASQSAGHTGHNNEIIGIIEELREAKIIR